MRIERFITNRQAFDRLGEPAFLNGLDGSMLDKNPAAPDVDEVGEVSGDFNSDAGKLRRGAEERIAELAAGEAQELGDEQFHELRVHQIELEMQYEELRRVQCDLEAEREKYMDLFDRAPVGYLTLNERSIVTEANLTAHSLLGVEQPLLVGQPFGAFVIAEDRDLYDQYDFALVNSRLPQTCELRLVRQRGASGDDTGGFWARLDSRANPAAGVQSLSFRIAFVDITERKVAEEALRVSEERLRQLVESANDFVWEVDENGVYTFVSPQVTSVLGYEPAEVIGKAPFDLMPAEEAARIALQFDAIVGALEPFRNLENVCRHRDGHLVVMETNGVPFFDVAGALLGYRGTDRDVTERIGAEKALRKSQERLVLALRSADMGVWSLDIAENTRTLDDRCCRLLGIDPTAFTGTAEEFFAAIHPDDVGAIKKALARTIEQGIHYEPEYRAVWPDGSSHWVAARGTLDLDDDGRPTRINGVLWDVTKRRQDLQRLTRALTSTVEIVSQVSETRDPYTAGHQRRVSELAVAIAQETGMPDEQLEQIRVAGLLHDIGKMSVPAEILSKPGKLSAVEFELIKIHSEAGHHIIAAAHMEGPAAEIVYQHHERCDGSGYPRGLAADELLPESKVLMVADVVEAMMSHRPYRPSLGQDAALAEIERGAGSRYDSQVTEACVRVFRERGFEFSDL